MRGDLRSSCSRPVLAALLGVQLIGLAFAASAPARAAEDDNVLNSFLGVFGMQFKKEDEVIDYRARPPLVVPPNAEQLPPPVPAGAARTAEWPNDPDVMARRKAAADSRRPAPQTTPNARAELSKEELMQGRGGGPNRGTGASSECAVSAGTPSCLYTPWDELKAKKESADDKNIVIGGEEPPRNYLTEPPVGYRKASATVKATREAVKERVDPGDAGAYAREQGRHKTSVDD